MPESRLERTRKLYAELNISLPDTSKPHWWVSEYEFQLPPSSGSQFLLIDGQWIEVHAKIDPNA